MPSAELLAAFEEFYVARESRLNGLDQLPVLAPELRPPERPVKPEHPVRLALLGRHDRR